MAIFADRHQKDWDDHIPLLLMSYRSAVHESTRQTSANLMFERELNLPIDLLYGRPPGILIGDTDDYLSKLQKKMEDVHEFARILIRVASDKKKRRGCDPYST